MTRLCGHCWPSWPILSSINKIKIVSDIGKTPSISVLHFHLNHDNDIGLLLTVAMKCLHSSLFCQKILAQNFRTNFPSTLCKRTSFQSAFFNVDEFSLGPVFIEPPYSWPLSLVTTWFVYIYVGVMLTQPAFGQFMYPFWVISVHNFFSERLDLDPSLFFIPPVRPGLRGHHFKVPQGPIWCLRRKSPFSTRVVIYWNRLSTFIVITPSINCFKRKYDSVWLELFAEVP